MARLSERIPEWCAEDCYIKRLTRWLFPTEVHYFEYDEHTPWVHTEFYHGMYNLGIVQLIRAKPLILHQHLHDLILLRDLCASGNLCGKHLFTQLMMYKNRLDFEIYVVDRRKRIRKTRNCRS